MCGVIRLGVCDARAALRTVHQADLSQRYDYDGQRKNPLEVLELCRPVVGRLSNILEQLQALQQRPQITRVHSDIIVLLQVFLDSRLFTMNSNEPLKSTHDALHCLGKICDRMNPARGGFLCLTVKILEMVASVIMLQVIASIFYNELQKDYEGGLSRL